MYVCGVTLYDELHLGHARAAVIFDLIRRYLEYRGYQVKYVTNFTDVDDKMINRAKALGISIFDLADKFIKEYTEQTKLLGIRGVDESPRATECIKEIIDLIKRLEEKGFAYRRDGDVFFRVKKFPQYGKLSRQSVEELQIGARLEINERKIDPLDFALWKNEKEGEPSWDSPWGKGRPGWHIECSAMAMKFLGEEIDIHGGGKDLVFPHHENEIAQSEGATNKKFVAYWVHNGLLTMKDQKMAKSTGNVFNLSRALKEFGGAIVRYYLLSAHYRNPLDYGEEALREAASSLKRIQNFLQRAEEIEGENRQTILSRDEETTKDLAKYADEMEQNFILAMNDDFDTPLVFSIIFEAVKKANLLMGKAAPLNKKARDALLKVRKEIKRIGEVLALFGEKKKKGLGKDAYQLIETLVTVRDELRGKKDWKLADEIRKKLDSLGIELEDTRTRTVWRLKGWRSSTGRAADL